MEKNTGPEEYEMTSVQEITNDQGRTMTSIVDEESFQSLVKEKTERLSNLRTTHKIMEGKLVPILPDDPDLNNPLIVTRIK